MHARMSGVGSRLASPQTQLTASVNCPRVSHTAARALPSAGLQEQPVLAEALLEPSGAPAAAVAAVAVANPEEPGMPRPAETGAENVPSTMRDAALLFLGHPTPAIIITGLLVLSYFRIQLPWQPADALVAACVACFWLGQEWVVHRALLHSSFGWPGRDIHEGHHHAPYYHVSIDGPAIILPAMALSGGALWAALGGSGLALTGASTYWAMGLAYEWTHFLVHTKVVPGSALGRRVRRHHMLHHCRSEEFWFSFLVPEVDGLLGTAPDPGAVPRSALARKGA